MDDDTQASIIGLIVLVMTGVVTVWLMNNAAEPLGIPEEAFVYGAMFTATALVLALGAAGWLIDQVVNAISWFRKRK